MTREELVKVRIRVPGERTERIWARQVEFDLYEIRNVPFSAYGVNFLDVVRARRSDDPSELPSVLSVVRRSGHRTIRVYFDESVAADERKALLAPLATLQVTYEAAGSRVGGGRLYALDIPQSADYQRVLVYLADMKAEGKAEFELGSGGPGDAPPFEGNNSQAARETKS